jgi:hypothetical protein
MPLPSVNVKTENAVVTIDADELLGGEVFTEETLLRVDLDKTVPPCVSELGRRLIEKLPHQRLRRNRVPSDAGQWEQLRATRQMIATQYENNLGLRVLLPQK